jgi:hypothetical protein
MQLPTWVATAGPRRRAQQVAELLAKVPLCRPVNRDQCGPALRCSPSAHALSPCMR